MKTGERITGEDLLSQTLEVCEGGTLKVVGDKWPRVDDELWFVGSFGAVECHWWDGNGIDLLLTKYNRIFPSKELALEYAEYLKKKAELSFEPDWEDCKQNKYYFGYNHEICTLYVGKATVGQVGQQLYFPNEDGMRELVREIGTRKFLYFEFGIPMESD